MLRSSRPQAIDTTHEMDDYEEIDRAELQSLPSETDDEWEELLSGSVVSLDTKSQETELRSPSPAETEQLIEEKPAEPLQDTPALEAAVLPLSRPRRITWLAAAFVLSLVMAILLQRTVTPTHHRRVVATRQPDAGIFAPSSFAYFSRHGERVGMRCAEQIRRKAAARQAKFEHRGARKVIRSLKREVKLDRLHHHRRQLHDYGRRLRRWHRSVYTEARRSARKIVRRRRV